MDQRICNVARELREFGRMNMAALRAKYREAFGEETTSHNAAYLRGPSGFSVGVVWPLERCRVA